MSNPPRPGPRLVEPYRHDTPVSPVPSALARTDHASVLRRLDQVEERIDALISDTRNGNVANKAAFDGIRRELRAIRARLTLTATAEQLAEHDKRVTDASVELMRLGGVVATLGTQLGEVKSVLGNPPVKLDTRSSQAGQLTPQEIRELEDGTGVAGAVGKVVVQQDKMVRRTGVAAVLGTIAGSAPSWVPPIIELLSK